MTDLPRRALQFIRRHGLLESGDTVVLGLSGGPDSVALGLLLCGLSDDGALPLRLHLAHFNHGLRGAQADADEAFCKDFAEARGLPFRAEKADVAAAARQERQSLEDAARDARYAFLRRVAEEVQGQAVATAHHADDVAETILMRLIRGAGVRGLAAMAPARPLSEGSPHVRLVRPLLEVRKSELLDFLTEQGQPFCEDMSNLDASYTRNRVRHELIPALRRDYPQFSVGSLCALNQAALEATAALDEFLENAWSSVCKSVGDDAVVLRAEAMAGLPRYVRKLAGERALAALAKRSGLAVPALRAEHYEALASLPDREVGAGTPLPGGLTARREHGLIYIGRTTAAAPSPSRRLAVPGEVEVPEAGMRISCRALPAGSVGPSTVAGRASAFEVFVGRDAIGEPLGVRFRRTGDRFQPLGMPRAARLKKFLIARKAPLHQRDRIPLVIAADGEIAWVVGHAIGERFKLREPNQRVLHLKAEVTGGSGGSGG